MNREMFKQVGKKGLICALALTMSLAVVPPAMAAEPPENQVAKVEFSDITGHWAEKDILAMCEGENPLFNGVGTGADGKAIFAPDNKMTGYEFITVIVRALYPEEIRATQKGENWYNPTYEVAVEHSLLHKELDLSQPISRQDMAKIMAKVLKKQGEDTSKLVSSSKIADYNAINGYYQHDVRVVYSLGIITGTDSNGTFSPTGTVDRAQGATILHRLLDKTCRATVDLSDTSGDIYAPVKEHQEWVEGEKHGIPKEGDVVIKADGTRVTLKETVFDNGVKVLGVGQGVDYVTGTVVNGTVYKVGYGGFYSNDATKFIKCERTGDVYSQNQWTNIRTYLNPEVVYGDNYVGDYDGEVCNYYWEWSAEEYCWNYFGGH